MIDAPGPWGTGPFTVVDGHSTLDTEQVVIQEQPFVATYLWREDRTPRVHLQANLLYWDRARGPHLQHIIFRNDLDQQEALDRVRAIEGEVDIVTEVAPADAARVEQSPYAKLIAIDAVRSVFGIINRDAEGLPLGDIRARQALNHAIDRDALVGDAMHGYAKPLAGLTPPAAIPRVDRVLHPFFKPYSYDLARARQLWSEAGGVSRPIRIATLPKLEPVAQQAAADLRHALAVDVEVMVYQKHEEQLQARRALAERTLPRPWDVLIWEQGAQETDGVALELHHAIAGAQGEYRAGPPVAEFDALFAELQSHTSKLRQLEVSRRMDLFVHEQALALFLCAPQALYAVNKHVEFTPYRTTFELARCRVDEQHWSRRQAKG